MSAGKSIHERVLAEPRVPGYFECEGYRDIPWVAIDMPSALGCQLQLRRIDRSTAIEVTLNDKVALLTGAQVDEFWRMVEKLKE